MPLFPLMFQPLIKLDDLQLGDIVRPRHGTVSYIVTNNWGKRVTAVRTTDITNPSEWEVLKDSQPLDRYVERLHIIRETARNLGYAIGEHGSRRRDLDLIAVPWIDQAVSADILALAICQAVNGVMTRQGQETNEPTIKPRGRLAWSIQIGGGLYIDLSVMTEGAAAG